jgi:hypothetical protein
MFIRIIRALFWLAACIAPTLAAADERATPVFQPLQFFEGRTEGNGEVKIMFKTAHAVRVHGRGRIEPDGTLVLVQDVLEDGKPLRKRSWHIRETAPGRYAATLSDATGPVRLEAIDGRFLIKFKMKGGLGIEQWLTAAPGGRVVRNSMVIRKFGITVAKLEETIRKLD